MLDGAYTSPKPRMLAALLKIQWPYAVGLCGLLWRFTAKHAPTGEVGLHSDEEIAIALEWPGEPSKLVEAFVRAKLLDAVDAPCRLLVHDWPEHSPRHVRATLQRKGIDFSPLYRERSTRPTTDETAVPPTVEVVDSNIVSDIVTTSSSSTSPVSSPPPPSDSSPRSLGDLATYVWDAYVQGKKQGKKPGLEAIRRSIKKKAAEGYSVKEAAEYIRERTQEFAINAIAKVANGETEMRYIPQAGTFFRQERWNDDDTEPTREQVEAARIEYEIQAARAELGSELGTAPRALP